MPDIPDVCDVQRDDDGTVIYWRLQDATTAVSAAAREVLASVTGGNTVEQIAITLAEAGMFPNPNALRPRDFGVVIDQLAVLATAGFVAQGEDGTYTVTVAGVAELVS